MGHVSAHLYGCFYKLRGQSNNFYILYYTGECLAPEEHLPKDVWISILQDSFVRQGFHLSLIVMH
jgi:hypothetical protein